MESKQYIFRVRNKLESTHEDICRMRRNYPNAKFKATHTFESCDENGKITSTEDIRILTKDNSRVFGLKFKISPAIDGKEHKDVLDVYLKHFNRVYEKILSAMEKESSIVITVNQYFRSEDDFFNKKNPNRIRVYVNKNEDTTAPDFVINDGLVEFYVKPFLI